MGKKLFNLKTELQNLDISVEHKTTIENLIRFYEEHKRPSIEGIISDIEKLAGETGLFIGAETSAGYYDETVKKAQKEVRALCEAKGILKEIEK